ACVQIIRPYATAHDISQDASAWLLALMSGMHVVATIVLGFLSDRIGNRLPFAGLALLMGVGAVLLAVGSDLPVVTIGCTLVGLGGGVIALLAAAVAMEFGAKGVGRAFGMCMFFIPLVTLAPFSIKRTQEATGSYAPPFIGWAILVAVSAVLSLWLQERRKPAPVPAEPMPEVPAG
ncbi:MAG TPA: MFS transporter, partial [Steroidobacteraceae bacterium]|nr:MFS transporter [Steroidobacteraceae bacterium]